MAWTRIIILSMIPRLNPIICWAMLISGIVRSVWRWKFLWKAGLLFRKKMRTCLKKSVSLKKAILALLWILSRSLSHRLSGIWLFILLMWSFTVGSLFSIGLICLFSEICRWLMWRLSGSVMFWWYFTGLGLYWLLWKCRCTVQASERLWMIFMRRKELMLTSMDRKTRSFSGLMKNSSLSWTMIRILIDWSFICN